MTFKPKCPTCVSQVNDALIVADDFLTAAMLMTRTGLRSGQVSASLHHLYKHRAADFVAAPEGLWWYATPDEDTRTRVVAEKSEKPQTRKRRVGIKRGPNKGFRR